MAAFPFTVTYHSPTVSTAAESQLTISERDQLSDEVRAAMETAAPAFFANDSQVMPSHYRHGLEDTFGRLAPYELLPWYRALVPDFFEWLTA
jgi:hypothetical protein